MSVVVTAIWVVVVASYWAGGLDLDDPEFRRRRYNNDQAYRQSKQADCMLTVAFARRLQPGAMSYKKSIKTKGWWRRRGNFIRVGRTVGG